MVKIAIIKFINSPRGQTRGSMGGVMKYCTQAKKAMHNGIRLVSGVNCLARSAFDDFFTTKLQHQKTEGRLYYHMVQSFPKGENISPETAHEIALKFAESFSGYEVLVSTHCDREHIHSHFIINSVSYQTGKKFHLSTKDLIPLREKNDTLCQEYGFSVCQPKQEKDQAETQNSALSTAEYHAAVKGESWKFRLMNTIDECMKYTSKKESFMELMRSEGYELKWTPSRKSVTYITPEGKKCRDKKLHQAKYLKEMMELEFGIREGIILRRIEKQKQTAESYADTDRGLAEFSRHDEPAASVQRETGTADESSSAASQQAEYGGYQRTVVGDTAYPPTGWEQEREEALPVQIPLAESPSSDLGMAGNRGFANGINRSSGLPDSPPDDVSHELNKTEEGMQMT